MLILVLVENDWKWSCGDWRQGELTHRLTHSYTLYDCIVNVLTCFDHVFRDASGAIHGSTGHCCLAISDLKQPAFEVKQKAQAAEQQNGEVFFGVFLFWPSVSRRPIHSGARQTRSSASHSKDHQNPRGAGPAGPAWRRWTVTCDLPRWNMNLV